MSKYKVKAPAVGEIIRVIKNEGEDVNYGETICIIEVMRMELEIKATASGVIHYLPYGATVQKDEVIAEIEDSIKTNNDVSDNDVSDRKSIREKYQKEVEEHRRKGDLIDYLWDVVNKGMIPIGCFDSYSPKAPNSGKHLAGYEIFSALKKKEIKEAVKFLDLCVDRNISKTCEFSFTDREREGFNYLFKLSQKPKDSIEYKRFENFYNSILKSGCRDRLEQNIKIEKKYRLIKKITVITILTIIVSSISTCSINRAITKDARLAKQEAQRIEKIKVKNAKNVAKNQANDIAQLEKLGSAKLKMQDILVSTSEPSMYIIAPMSYDTKKFVEDNSHDKGLFGTKDNSVERLTILESCITDFQNSIDSKTGVSFLDRSKISQIEKEHKFQLGDWSNNKKTAEVGKALNANILLFLDKFGFIDNGSGEYRFEAKFVDINTMQSTSYNVVYQNAKKKVVTPGVVQTISFRDFTPVSTKKNPFADEFELKTLKGFRTVQKNDLKEVSPLGQVTKVELSEFDTKAPATDLFNATSIYFDGFGSVEFTYADKKENSTYTFDAIEMNLERMGNLFFTDGKIGTLTVKTDSGYKKYDVFTENNREYYILLGSVTLEKATVHYYLQMVKQ